MCSMKFSGRAHVILIMLEGRRYEFLARLYESEIDWKLLYIYLRILVTHVSRIAILALVLKAALRMPAHYASALKLEVVAACPL